MCCLSKGLAAPVGSLVIGDREFIAAARRVRKVLGGGMRQAGVLAAPGLIAITRMQERLADDHRRAKDLACRLSGQAGLTVVPPETNIVIVELGSSHPDAAGCLARLRERAVLAVAMGPRRLRFVTHKDVDDADVARAADALLAAIRESDA
jgi:threonine aldolase